MRQEDDTLPAWIDAGFDNEYRQNRGTYYKQDNFQEAITRNTAQGHNDTKQK
jgi:hypothetical protein